MIILTILIIGGVCFQASDTSSIESREKSQPNGNSHHDTGTKKRPTNWETEFLPLYSDNDYLRYARSLMLPKEKKVIVLRQQPQQQEQTEETTLTTDSTIPTLTEATDFPSSATTTADTGVDESCFSTYWNVPSERCTAQLGTELPLLQYGIRANPGQTFYGTVVNIFYDKRGAWPYLEMAAPAKDTNTNTSTLIDTWEQYFLSDGERRNRKRKRRQLIDSDVVDVNGGLPQRGDLQAHLTKFGQSVDTLLPDPNYDGLAVIDFEQFTLDLNMIQGKFSNLYKKKSLEFAREFYPNVTDEQQLISLSRELFNNSARQFFEQTLQLGIQMRPNAKWGYYGFPYCFRTDLTSLNCSTRNQRFNDDILWLYELSTAAYPSIYLHKKALPSPIDTGVWIHKEFAEVQRIQGNIESTLPAYAYFRYEYPADYTDQTENFLNLTDVVFSYKQAMDFGMAGMVVWGSSNNMTQKCADLSAYIQKILGPIQQQTNEFCDLCKAQLCPGIGSGFAHRDLIKNNFAEKASTTAGCVANEVDSFEYIYGVYASALNSNIFPTDNATISLEYNCHQI